jgi:MFS family permease
MFGVGLGGSVLHPTGYPLISENITSGGKGRVLGMWGSAAKLGDGFAPAVVGVFLLAFAWTDILLLLSLTITGYSVYLFVALDRFETHPMTEADTDNPRQGSPDDASTSGRRNSLLTGDSRLYLYPFLLIFLFFAIRMLAVSGVNVFIPEFITSEYGYSFVVAGIDITPESTASFYYASLLITAGFVQILVGRLIEIYDTRKIILGILLVAALVLTSLAIFNFSPIVLFVVLLSLGGSLWAVQPARDALISDISPENREGRTFGYLWTGALLVSALSPVLIGYIGERIGLRSAFAFLALTTLLSTVPIALLFSNRLYLQDHTSRSVSMRNDD